MGRSFIILPELQTLVVEVEAILNDRPLTYVSSDIQDDEPLLASIIRKENYLCLIQSSMKTN